MFSKYGDNGHKMIAEKIRWGKELKDLCSRRPLVPEHVASPILGKVLQSIPHSPRLGVLFNFYFKSLDSFNIQVVAKSGHV